MTKYLAKRLLYMLIVLFGVTFFTFLVTASTPGGTAAFRGQNSDSPLLLRYWVWLRTIFFVNPGGVYAARGTIFLYFGQMIPGTVRLAAVSLLTIVSASIPLGILTAVKKGSALDNAVRFITYSGAAFPNFSLAILLIFVFGVKLRWFPVLGTGNVHSMVLPVCALTVPLVSRYIRQVRGAVLEELSQEYVAGAAARGIGQWRAIYCHVLPNALPAILTYLGVSISHLFSGLAIIETIFMWRGIGALAVTSMRAQDSLIVQAYVLWMAVLYICASFAIDTAKHLIDPQFRRKGAA